MPEPFVGSCMAKDTLSALLFTLDSIDAEVAAFKAGDLTEAGWYRLALLADDLLRTGFVGLHPAEYDRAREVLRDYEGPLATMAHARRAIRRAEREARRERDPLVRSLLADDVRDAKAVFSALVIRSLDRDEKF